MKIRSIRLAVLMLSAVALTSSGCSPGENPVQSLGAPNLSASAGSLSPLGSLKDPPAFDPSAFGSVIDHPYFPLVPGTMTHFAGAGETIDVEVLHERKNILGIDATVVRDRVYVAGELAEDTFDWYAQDQAGNVWYLGEDSKEYANGVVVSTHGSWEAGVDGAQPGFVMEAHPRPGDTYRQEYAPGVAEDMATVVSLKKNVTVPYGTFDGCIQTTEFTHLAPGNRGSKYYARGVGLVLEVAPRGGRERVELVSVEP